MPWDVDTLKEHIDRILGEQEKAREIAKGEVDRRLDQMNELRDQIDAERGRYLSVERYEDRHRELERTISAHESRLSNLEGGNQIKASTVTWVLAVLGLFVTVVVIGVNALFA